jgi:hypothetical protein
MKTKTVALSIIVVALGIGRASAETRQVKVTAERAAIYVEPNRNSSRFDFVKKGELLDLFQQQKVKDVWYYVSYNSPRYGSRITGFILASAVEFVSAEKPTAEPTGPISPQKKPAPEPASVEPTPAKPAAQTVPEQPKGSEPKRPSAKQETFIQKQAPVEYGMVIGLTPLLPGRRVPLPQRSSFPEEKPWKIIEPTAPQVKKEPEKPAVRILPPARSDQRKPVGKPIPEMPRPAAPQPEKRPAATPSPPPPIKPARVITPTSHHPLLSVGLGYGSSYGGAGGCLGLNLTSNQVLHGGFGLYPMRVIYSDTSWVRNKTLWSLGLRYYLPISPERVRPFLDLQYGGLRVEAAQIIAGIFEYAYVYTHEQKTLWGPSLLAGLEIRLGRFGLAGGIGASYSITDWEYLEQRLALAFEVGLLIRL